MVYADDVRSHPPSAEVHFGRGAHSMTRPIGGSHTAGACVLNPCVAGIRFDERHPEQSPEFSGHPHTNGGWGGATPPHLSKVGCISKTARAAQPERGYVLCRPLPDKATAPPAAIERKVGRSGGDVTGDGETADVTGLVAAGAVSCTRSFLRVAAIKPVVDATLIHGLPP